MLRALLASLLLATSLVAAETPLTPTLLTEDAGAQWSPAIAGDADGFLLVWSDARGGFYASRAGADGALLEATGTPVGAAGSPVRMLRSGSGYLLVSRGAAGMNVLRLDRQGRLFDARPLVVGEDTLRFGPIAAANQTTALFAGTDGQITLTDDKLATLLQVTWSDAALSPIPGAAATDGTDYLLAGTPASNSVVTEIAVRRLTRDGLASQRVTVVTGARDISRVGLVWTGTTYLLVWADAKTGIFGRRLQRDGNPAGDAFAIAADPSANFDLASRGDGEALVATALSDVAAIRVDGSNGVTAHAVGPVGTTAFVSPQVSVAAGAAGYAVAWETGTDRPTVDVAALDATGARRDGVDPAAPAVNRIVSPVPQTAFAAGSDFAAWVEESAGVTYIAGGRVPGSPAGTIAGSLQNQTAPAVAAGASSRLIVWLESSPVWIRPAEVRGILLSATAEAPVSFHIGDGSYDTTRAPAVLWDGQQYVVAFSELDRTTGGVRAVTARVTESGLVFAARPLGAYAAQGRPAPALARGGGTTLVTWMIGEQPYDCPVGCHFNYGHIYGAFLTADGAASAPFLVSEGRTFEVLPAAAADGSVFLVAWTTGRRIHARRIGRDGAIIDAVPLDLGPATPDAYPAATFDGSRFVVTWESGDPDHGIPPMAMNASIAPSGGNVRIAAVNPVNGAGQRHPVPWRTPAGTVVVYERDVEASATEAMPHLWFAPTAQPAPRRRAVR